MSSLMFKVKIIILKNDTRYFLVSHLLAVGKNTLRVHNPGDFFFNCLFKTYTNGIHLIGTFLRIDLT